MTTIGMIDFPTIKNVIDKSVARLLDKDQVLLRENLSELCIAHRLAMYIQRRLAMPKLNVDIEYNRRTMGETYVTKNLEH